MPLAMSEPQSGNHTDMFEIGDRVDEVVEHLKDADIQVDGLFCNLDADFDGSILRMAFDRHGIISNVCPNRRNGAESSDEWCFYEEMYSEHWIVERSDAWMAGFKSVLMRFDTTIASWKGWNYLAMIAIPLKKFHKSN